jgi:hypothetical protein
MTKLRLTDRIVVEIKGKKAGFDGEFIAQMLEKVANNIREGLSGTEITTDRCEVLWQHECPEYGGFKIVGDKSLISQYYYHSELAPRIISEELSERIRKFNMDYEENEQQVGEDIFTKTDYLQEAVYLLSEVEQQTKIAI